MPAQDISLESLIELDVHIIIAGFSCKDLSGLKRGHAAEAHDGCLEETSSSTGSTRSTFEGGCGLLRALWPACGLLENVFKLVGTTKKGKTCDAPINALQRRYSTLGYELTWAKSYAQYYGLPVKRPRVYIPFTRVVRPQDVLLDFQKAVNDLTLDQMLWTPGQHAR